VSEQTLVGGSVKFGRRAEVSKKNEKFFLKSLVGSPLEIVQISTKYFQLGQVRVLASYFPSLLGFWGVQNFTGIPEIIASQSPHVAAEFRRIQDLDEDLHALLKKCELIHQHVKALLGNWNKGEIQEFGSRHGSNPHI
jgi:hypothetical protein